MTLFNMSQMKGKNWPQSYKCLIELLLIQMNNIKKIKSKEKNKN